MIDCSKTKNYLSEKKRMTKLLKDGTCGIDCADCPLSSENNGTDIICTRIETLYPEKVIEIVQKWSDEHPQKTFLTELLKNYPNVEVGDNGMPNICPYQLGLISIENCRCSNGCDKCWNQIIPSEK